MGCFREFRLKFPDRNLRELSGIVLVNLVVSVVLKILPVSFPCTTFQTQITADISKTRETVQGYLTFIFDLLSESLTGFVSHLVSLAVENVVSFT